LRQRLRGFERFRALDDVTIKLGDEAVAPSASDIGTRTALVRNRLSTIVKTNLAEADERQVEEIQAHMQGFDSATQTLQENVDNVQQAEANLLATTGEFLFGEEEGRREAPTDGEQ